MPIAVPPVDFFQSPLSTVAQTIRDFLPYIVFATMMVIPFTDKMVAKAHEIVLDLKRKNLLLEMGDVMIAATAMVECVPLATLNRKHFERIEGLILFDDERNP
jgi:predicted nucleic acid-binding protein